MGSDMCHEEPGHWPGSFILLRQRLRSALLVLVAMLSPVSGWMTVTLVDGGEDAWSAAWL
jgi:hypothetical protein